MAGLTEIFKAEVVDLVKDYAYIDDAQDSLLALLVDAAAAKLLGAGCPAQESNPEYKEAVMMLTAYRYVRRTSLSTSIGATEADENYTAMVRDYVHRLRYPEVENGNP